MYVKPEKGAPSGRTSPYWLSYKWLIATASENYTMLINEGSPFLWMLNFSSCTSLLPTESILLTENFSTCFWSRLISWSRVIGPCAKEYRLWCSTSRRSRAFFSHPRAHLDWGLDALQMITWQWMKTKGWSTNSKASKPKRYVPVGER